jgi:hypothetical protein
VKEELEDKLYGSFASLFLNSLPYGIECEDGWFELIFNLCEQLKDENIEVTQIKEKFGTLRFYCNFENDKIKDLVRIAEIKASVTCEFCGKAGQLYSKGWCKTLCNEHANEFYKEEYKYDYICENCNFNFNYEGDLETFQCPRCRCEKIAKKS